MNIGLRHRAVDFFLLVCQSFAESTISMTSADKVNGTLEKENKFGMDLKIHWERVNSVRFCNGHSYLNQISKK